MKDVLLAIQIITSALLVLAILLQSKGTGLGAAFGGEGSIYRSKRGVEKLFVYFTVILAFIFLVLSVTLVLV